MLQITIPSFEIFDEKTSTFCEVKGKTIALEHSLISISKWEAKWNKPFLSSQKTPEQLLDYIKFMTITTGVDPMLYEGLTQTAIQDILDYINSSQTATWFNTNETGKKKNSTGVTSELIYYWMVSYQIPFECQKWHLNRLITLIKICDIKNKPSKKMSKREILSNNAKLNAARRAKLKTKG